MDLPKKDKHGNNYLSYSQISTFKRDKTEYYDQYILKTPFKGNAYTDFGSKIGEALEHNFFDNFELKEKKILESVKRLDLFERKTILNYEGFYVIGYIDTCKYNFKEIIDYKTGGKGKDLQYKNKEYTQLQIYALSLRQETGITPSIASVQFITRAGNAFKGENLYVANIKPIEIEIDLSISRLKSVYWGILKTAKEISEFYKKYK